MNNMEAIELLQSGSKMPKSMHTSEMLDEACRLACRALQKEPRWISVEECLPEQGKEVLLLAHGWEGRLHYIGKLEPSPVQEGFFGKSKASEWTIWGWSYFREPRVTHWMPLPEPPSEDGVLSTASKIRSMTDDELASFLCHFRTEDDSGYSGCDGCAAEGYCHPGHTGMIDWIHRPWEENGHGK